MGNHSGAAAVIDLEEYRRKRAAHRPASGSSPSTPGSVPVVVWVMVWPTG